MIVNDKPEPFRSTKAISLVQSVSHKDKWEVRRKKEKNVKSIGIKFHSKSEYLGFAKFLVIIWKYFAS